MFWFAWTGEFNSIHWIVPTLAGVFLNTAVMLIFVCYLNYLTDSYLMFAASAVAGNTIVRSAMGAAAPLYTEQMFSALGVGGAGSLIGGVACLLAVIPFLFYKYGANIRMKSKFAPTQNLPGDKANGDSTQSNAHSSANNAVDEAERALDEEMGIPDQEELEEQIEKERSRESHSSHGDPYIDASGMEKAER
jgi:hypothetical protein